MFPLFWARVVTRVPLSPVARRSRPDLVRKYRSRISFTTTASTRERISFRAVRERSPNRAMVRGEVKMVSTARSTVTLDPASTRLMEDRAVMVMIPASRSRTFSFTWIRPVHRPATAPAPAAHRRVTQGFTPWRRRMAVTAAPRGKLLSTVRSGKSSTE